MFSKIKKFFEVEDNSPKYFGTDNLSDYERNIYKSNLAEERRQQEERDKKKRQEEYVKKYGGSYTKDGIYVPPNPEAPGMSQDEYTERFRSYSPKNYSVSIDGKKILSRAHINKWQIIHIKGFASGINYREDKAYNLYTEVKNLIRSVSENREILIVWDGDNYAEDSYTKLISRLMVSESSRYHFLGFVCNNDVERFKKSWNNIARKMNKQIYLYNTNLSCKSDGSDFHKLGLKALELTHSRTLKTSVICIGGGSTVEKEYNHISEDSRIDFYVFSYYRIVDGEKRYSHLLSGIPDRVLLDTVYILKSKYLLL